MVIMPDMWIVIENKVYDVTRWSKIHPGGARIISHYAGQDATDAWIAVHNNKEYVRKFLKQYYVRDLTEETPLDPAMTEFRDLRKQVERMGLFHTNMIYYVAFLLQIVAMEIACYLMLSYYGDKWLPWIFAAILFAAAQAQAGWLQHDLGHLSVFKNNRLNHIGHHLIIGAFKGASSHWWNFRHQQHHVKPNMIKKDPDVNLAYIFLMGKMLPEDWGRKKRGFMPYNLQHKYFFMIGPPLLLPIYFHLEVLYFVIKRRDWLDLALVGVFFARYFYIFSPILGVSGATLFYVAARFIESHWFVWCTQMSHIPMKIDKDDDSDWLRMQLAASCNVKPGWFNDWFCGHLNYQIEHHLFPTMPSHNYPHVQPLVKSLCDKHGIEYVSKDSLWQAWSDVVESLRDSGEIWYKAYHSLG